MEERQNQHVNQERYIALTVASPTASNSDHRVLNIGIENDWVYSAAVTASPQDNANENLYLIHDTFEYASGGNIFDLFGTVDRVAHDVAYSYYHVVETLFSSEFYHETSRDSHVVVNILDERDIHALGLVSADFFNQVGAQDYLILGHSEDISYAVNGTDGAIDVFSTEHDILIGAAGNDTLEGFDGNDILIGGQGIDLYAGGEGADVFAGRLSELDGDTVHELDVSDRILVQGAEFETDDISVFEGGIRLTTAEGTAEIMLDVPPGTIPVAQPARDLNGLLGTWITFEPLGNVSAGVSSTSNVYVNVFESDDRFDEQTAREITPILTTSVSDGGGTAFSSVSLLDASVSVDLSSSEWFPTGETARTNAHASLYENLRFENPNVGFGERWSVIISLDAYFNYDGYHGNQAITASFGTASFSVGPHIAHNTDNDFFGLRYSYVNGAGVREDGETTAGGYTFEYFFDGPVGEISLGLSASLEAWTALGERMSISAGASFDIIGLPDGASFTSETGFFLNSGQFFEEDDTIGPALPSLLTQEELSLEAEGELTGGNGNSLLQGSVGSDVLIDLSGHNQLEGGVGNDTLTTGDGNDVLIGGHGYDLLTGGAGDDHLVGNDQNDTLHGGAGNDILDGGRFADVLVYTSGHDLLLGGNNDDVIQLHGTELFGTGYVAFNVSSDTQVGTQARISIEGQVRSEAVIDGGFHYDTVRLSVGNDAFFLHDAFSGFHESLDLTQDAFGRASVARFSNISFIEGLGGDDIIDLTSPDYSLFGASLVIDGGSGNDVIWGSDADETIYGGVGNDTVFAGIGNDVVYGGDGADTFEFTRTSTNTAIADFDGDEGDRLLLYNTGGATFDLDTLSLTDTGIAVSFTDNSLSDSQVIEIALATNTEDFSYTREDVLSFIDVV